ncbi:MAG: hypothetical protein ACOY3Z_00610 [Thermodesulfobacteriota bacterium]
MIRSASPSAFSGHGLVCFCFGHTAEAIRQEVLAHNGRSLIMERILAEKRQGGCRCAEKNPHGR